MGETYVTLWGNIATDPKSLSTPSGVRMTKFRLACTASRRDAQTGEFTDGTTSWYSVVCWRELAVNVAASLTKGEPVVVYGKQVVRDWEAEDGRKGTEVSIDAVSVGHDLRRGQARFQRIKRDQPAGAGDEPPTPLALTAVPSAGLETEPAQDPWAEDGSDGRPELQRSAS
jgi:single-strand DNA-binding protein